MCSVQGCFYWAKKKTQDLVVGNSNNAKGYVHLRLLITPTLQGLRPIATHKQL